MSNCFFYALKSNFRKLTLAEVESFLVKIIPILPIFVYNIECMFDKQYRLIFCAKIDNLLSRT